MKSIWAAIKPTLIEALGSKKVLAMLSGGIVQGITSLIGWLHINGWEVDQNAVDRYLALVAVYIVGQAVVDHGATAAQVKADNPVAVAPAVSVATTQSGTIEVKS